MNMQVDPSFFPPVLAPVAEAGILAGITDHDARLITDLVLNLKPKADVLANYGITMAELTAKAASPAWANMYREMDRVWKSEMNTAQRVRLKAALLLEDSLVPIYGIIANPNMPVAAKLNAFEQLTKVSTVANVPRDATGNGEKHSITINIGGDKAPVVIATETNNGRPGTIIDAR
jgi:hypothetical protein